MIYKDQMIQGLLLNNERTRIGIDPTPGLMENYFIQYNKC